MRKWLPIRLPVAATILALCALAASVVPAEGAGVRRTYIDAGLRVAERYWGGRDDGVHRCADMADVRVVAPRRLHGLTGAARLGGCEIGRPDMLLSRDAFDKRWSYLRWPLICKLVTHELGHLLGRGHTGQGLMEAEGPVHERWTLRYCGREPVTGEPVVFPRR